MTYKFNFKRFVFWKTVEVVGHNYVPEQNKMILYMENGGIQEIKDWTKCEVKLGFDWTVAVRKHMETQSGQAIAINRK